MTTQVIVAPLSERRAAFSGAKGVLISNEDLRLTTILCNELLERIAHQIKRDPKDILNEDLSVDYFDTLNAGCYSGYGPEFYYLNLTHPNYLDSDIFITYHPTEMEINSPQKFTYYEELFLEDLKHSESEKDELECMLDRYKSFLVMRGCEKLNVDPINIDTTIKELPQLKMKLYMFSMPLVK